MKTIETLYNFAQRLGYHVNWADEEANTFTELVQANNHNVELLVQQDGDRITVSSPKLSLSTLDDAERDTFLRKSLESHFNTHSSLVFALNKDTLYAQVNIGIRDNIDDVMQQYIAGRDQVIKSVTISDILSLTE